MYFSSVQAVSGLSSVGRADPCNGNLRLRLSYNISW